MISSSPAFLLGGDTPGYVAFIREIIQNGFIIPSQNTLHFPGSYWVYPPLLPYFWAVVTHLLGGGTLTPFYVIEVSGMVADSLVVIPVFLISRLVFNRQAAIVSSLLFAVYLPDLFALAWGGVPQLFATFLFAWVIYFTILISRESNRSIKNTLALGILLILLTLTHDLTIFVMIFSLLGTVVISLILKKIRIGGIRPNMEHLNSVIWKLPVAIIVSLPVFLVWYVPRYWWIIDAGVPYASSSLPPVFSNSASIFQIIWQGFEGFLSPLGFSMVFIPVAIWSIYLCFRKIPEKSGVLIIFTIVPLLIGVVDYHASIIVARMGYYTFFPALIISSYGVVHFMNSFASNEKTLAGVTVPHNRRKKVAAAIVIIPLLLVSTLGISYNTTAHSLYNSYLDTSTDNLIDYSTLNWIHSNIPVNSTFASYGEIGYYIMGYDGNPTLVYQDLKYLTQPAEWNESIAAYDLAYIPTHNITLTEHLISQYHVNYVTVSGGTPVPSFYTEVYSDSSTVIYQVS